jgi:tetratricopeptide (TPR) repeat protein
MTNNVTFVTSYLKIYDSEYDETKTFEKRLELFMKIVELNINVCLFISPEFKNIFDIIANKYKNLIIVEVLSIEDLEFTKIGNKNADLLVLPERRSFIKDHINYMFLMNSKIEFIKKAIDVNPFNNDYFCWFDFSLPYIFKNLENSLLKIKKYSETNFISTPFMVMPGCWNFKVGNKDVLKDSICWRFCGGFFIGDKNSLLSFYDVSITHFEEFLRLTEKIVWEVNYWAWLEASNYISPIWYLADHNDSIINIPTQVINESRELILQDCSIYKYNYPEFNENDKFYPSSASYIYDKINNKHILNTRYVNYYYLDNWECIFYNGRRQIKTLNVKSELNKNFCEEPITYDIMNVEDTNFNLNPNSLSLGLEDIRLYDDNGVIKFIATNINYIPCGRNRMIIGDYDYENNICKNLNIVNMTWDSHCEKNWTPLPSYVNNSKLFIYKWSPYSVGFVNSENNFELHIQKQYENEILNKFRGSTPFIEYNEEYYVGLVHYSVPAVPPIYYNSLVLIDKKTNLPAYYSESFKFSNYPIEFCIGFKIEDSKYIFWVSQMDREPICFNINIDKIPITNKV